jgi:hypothetical protein
MGSSGRAIRAVGYVALASAAHAAVFLSMRVRPHEPRPASPEPDIAVEADVLPAEEPVRAVAPSRVDVAPPGPPHELGDARLARREAIPYRGDTQEPDSTESTKPRADESTSPESSPWSFDPRRPVDPTASENVARATQPPSLEAPTGGASTSGGLVEGLDAADAAGGMGRGGPAISALETAARGSDAHFEGVATFDVAVETNGHVSVTVLEASNAFSDWAKVADATRAALAPARFRIPPGARGWHVVARVEAKELFPSGSDPKTLGVKAEANPGRIVETKDHVDIQLPYARLAATGKVCGVSLTLGGVPSISGGCSLENMRANPIRVVRGRIVSEGRL